MPVPHSWSDVRRNVSQSLMDSTLQGIEQGNAAQLEADRIAAEEAAAEKKRQEELLQKAAQEARLRWEQQDAANQAEFGNLLSTKKKSGKGMPSLLQKAALAGAGQADDPNAIPLDGVPVIPGNTDKLSDKMGRLPLLPPPDPSPFAMAMGNPPFFGVGSSWFDEKVEALRTKLHDFVEEKAKEKLVEKAKDALVKNVPGVGPIVDQIKEMKKVNQLFQNDGRKLANDALGGAEQVTEMNADPHAGLVAHDRLGEQLGNQFGTDAGNMGDKSYKLAKDIVSKTPKTYDGEARNESGNVVPVDTQGFKGPEAPRLQFDGIWGMTPPKPGRQ